MHVEVVQTCAVDVNEDLSRGQFRGRGVLGESDLGGVSVVGHYKRAHGRCAGFL